MLVSFLRWGWGKELLCFFGGSQSYCTCYRQSGQEHLLKSQTDSIQNCSKVCT